MKKTRWILAALAACVAVLLAAGCDSEPDEEPEPGIEYDAGEWVITGTTLRQYRGKAADVEIPAGVTNIGNYAFSWCYKLTNVQYGGTEEGWNAITKGDNWDYNTGNYTITYNYKE